MLAHDRALVDLRPGVAGRALAVLDAEHHGRLHDARALAAVPGGALSYAARQGAWVAGPRARRARRTAARRGDRSARRRPARRRPARRRARASRARSPPAARPAGPRRPRGRRRRTRARRHPSRPRAARSTPGRAGGRRRRRSGVSRAPHACHSRSAGRSRARSVVTSPVGNRSSSRIVYWTAAVTRGSARQTRSRRCRSRQPCGSLVIAARQREAARRRADAGLGDPDRVLARAAAARQRRGHRGDRVGAADVGVLGPHRRGADQLARQAADHLGDRRRPASDGSRMPAISPSTSWCVAAAVLGQLGPQRARQPRVAAATAREGASASHALRCGRDEVRVVGLVPGREVVQLAPSAAARSSTAATTSVAVGRACRAARGRPPSSPAQPLGGHRRPLRRAR